VSPATSGRSTESEEALTSSPGHGAGWRHVNGEAAGSSGEEGAGRAVEAARDEGEECRRGKCRGMSRNGWLRKANHSRWQANRRTAVGAGAAGVVVSQGSRCQGCVRNVVGSLLNVRNSGGLGMLMRGAVLRLIVLVRRRSSRQTSLHQLVRRAAVLHAGRGDSLDRHRQNHQPYQQGTHGEPHAKTLAEVCWSRRSRGRRGVTTRHAPVHRPNQIAEVHPGAQQFVTSFAIASVIAFFPSPTCCRRLDLAIVARSILVRSICPTGCPWHDS
jgi:hypothetical protein